MKWGGRTLLVVAAASDLLEIYSSENKPRTITKKVAGWGAASVGAAYGAGITTETGPGMILGALIGGAFGYFIGENVTEITYDMIFKKEN